MGNPVIYVFRYLAISVYTVICGSLGMLAALVDRGGTLIPRIGRLWVGWIFRTCGVTVAADGLENINPRQAYVFMANHQSVFDIAAIIATLPVSWKFVYKKELAWIPFFGWAIWLNRHVMVDRGNRVRAVRSLQQAAERVREGTNVIIFPEGTRSESGVLGDFKSGGFHLAIQSGVPVLPISVSGGRAVTPKGSLRIESGHLHVVFGKPIPTEGLGTDDRAALKQEVRTAILQGFD